MTDVKLPAPTLVRRPEELHSLMETLLRQSIVAVDTESNSLFAYQERVCMVQFSTPERDYLLDPLAFKDLAPLAPLFSQPGIEKVFHAAEYDLLCLRRDYGFEFANLFDTMIAARILGREAVGLGSILEIEFGVHLDKRYQRANWGQRPLPADLLNYARFDTHYLIALRQRLHSELEQRDLLPLALEDFLRLAASRVNLSPDLSLPPTLPIGGARVGDKPLDCWRVSGAYDLLPQQAAVLVELCRYRDQVARAQDRPLFKVMGDSTLAVIAADTPQSLGELARMPGMNPRQVDRHGAQLLAAVQRGLKAAPVYPPRSPRPDERYLARLDRLRRWRKLAAETMGVGSDVVLPRDLLYELAERNPQSSAELAEILCEVPWRLEHYGAEILNALSGRNHP